MEVLKEKNEKQFAVVYFEKLIEKKEMEYFHLMKERLMATVFDVFVEKYDQDKFLIFEDKDDLEDVKFEVETYYFQYFKKFLENFEVDHQSYYNKSFLNLEEFNKNLFKIKDMIDLFFDKSVFNFIMKDFESAQDSTPFKDFVILEIMRASREVGLTQKIWQTFLESLDFKLKNYFKKLVKFLIFVFKDLHLISKYNAKTNLDVQENYFVLKKLQDLGFTDAVINMLMKMVVMFWQNLAFLVKLMPSLDRTSFNQAFEKFFQNLKIFIENLFYPE